MNVAYGRQLDNLGQVSAAQERGGSGSLNRIPASLSGTPTGVRGSALCCRAEGQRGIVSLIGRAPVKRGVRTTAVVKLQITTDRRARLRDALVSLEIDLLVLQCAPEQLDKHVVSP